MNGSFFRLMVALALAMSVGLAPYSSVISHKAAHFLLSGFHQLSHEASHWSGKSHRHDHRDDHDHHHDHPPVEIYDLDSAVVRSVRLFETGAPQRFLDSFLLFYSSMDFDIQTTYWKWGDLPPPNPAQLSFFSSHLIHAPPVV